MDKVRYQDIGELMDKLAAELRKLIAGEEDCD